MIGLCFEMRNVSYRRPLGLIKMKSILLILVLLISIPVLGQHNVTIKGKVIDDSLQKAVSRPSIELFTENGKYETQGSLDGLFMITLKTDFDTLLARLECHADSNIPTWEQIQIPIHSDTIINLTIGMPPIQVCHDAFLPSPIFFSQNKTLPKDADMTSTLTHFFSTENDQFMSDALRIKSGITVYCVQGYNEDEETASKRAKYISQFLSSNELLENKVTMEIVGKDEYFYCTHCEGCFEYYKYGEGIELNEEAVLNNPDLDTLRQVIEIKWSGNKK